MPNVTFAVMAVVKWFQGGLSPKLSRCIVLDLPPLLAFEPPVKVGLNPFLSPATFMVLTSWRLVEVAGGCDAGCD